MSERKVLTKYYPPEFDPSKIARTPKHLRPTGPKTIPVRLMAPFSMKCTSCGEYIYKGRKFNARKETTDEKYLTISIYRFYIRCTRCSSEITFKTDPKNMDYTCERGAKRNFESWRNPENPELKETDEERLDRLEREEAEEEENAERNAMEELEQKMEESKREMQVADALDEIMQRNARIERGEKGGKEDEALNQVRDLQREERERQEREDAEAARKAFEAANVERTRLEEQQKANGQSNHVAHDESDEPHRPAQPPPSFERVKKIKKPLVPGLVRKAEPMTASKQPPAPVPVQPPTLGLGGYDSDED
ncbi:Pre-mRNA-splicing factor cwf16 [Fonsecaea pedrosoi]|nr:Pre-mRNA-splicing factor cwf16 [Fonsecaea pedrosoi]